MSNLVLYSTISSPPCRAVLMTAEALGMELEIRETNFIYRDQFNSEFLKINPQHVVPTLDDNGFVLWDSHAIMSYFVNKYAPDHDLYPKDPEVRAKIDQFFHIDTGLIFNALRTICGPIFLDNVREIANWKQNMLDNAYEIFEKLLEGRKWLVGESYTLADISCVSTMSTLLVLKSLDNFPNIKEWIERCEKELPGYTEINSPGNKLFAEELRKRMPE